MVHNALMRGIDRRAADNARAAAGDDASDSSHVETASEVRLRYLNADESEVSDPERWLLLNYGEETEEEEENLEGWSMDNEKNVHVQTAEPLDLGGFVWVRRTPGATLRVGSRWAPAFPPPWSA